jgi:hypothetical protein
MPQAIFRCVRARHRAFCPLALMTFDSCDGVILLLF